MQGCCPVEFKIEGLYDFSFHIFELTERVSVGCDFDVVLGSWGVDFFVFAGDPKAGDTRKLVLFFGYFFLGCIVTEIAQSKVKSLFFQFKRVMNVYQPVDQNEPHFLGNILLNVFLLLFLDFDHKV